MVKPGWAQSDDGTWVYGSQEGKLTTGWAKIHGIWYRFDDNGIMNIGGYKVDENGVWVD